MESNDIPDIPKDSLSDLLDTPNVESTTPQTNIQTSPLPRLPHSTMYEPPESEPDLSGWINQSPSGSNSGITKPPPQDATTEATTLPPQETTLPNTEGATTLPPQSATLPNPPPSRPNPHNPSPSPDPDDFLAALGARLAEHNISIHGPVTRRFILGALRLLLYESEANVEQLASKIFDTIHTSLYRLHARQEKMLDALGMNSVALSLMVKGCLFCDGDKAGTGHLRGPEMMKHIRRHFEENVPEEVELGDEEVMEIGVESFPGQVDKSDLETPEQRRQLLRRIRNFLINDVRTECHHCEETFEFDYKWRWLGGFDEYKSYDFTALMNTHRYWCPVVEKLGSDGYPANLNELDYENKTSRMPHELKHARLSEMDQERVNMFRIYTRALVGQGKKDESDNGGGDDSGDEADDEDDIDSDYALSFGPEDDPPLEDEPAVPVPHFQKKSSTSGWPRHYLPALDNPILVLRALGHKRDKSPLPRSHWSDDALINFLADRNVKITGCGPLTRLKVLDMSDELLCHRSYSEWIRWMFPIPDRVDHDEKAEFALEDLGSAVVTELDEEGNVTKETPKKCPVLSAHFLFRYDMDKTNTLRCHTYQNLERFWNLLGFETYHPPDPTARAQLRRIGKEPDGEAPPLGWDTDDRSPIPGFVSRVLRHLRLIGFAWEAELTYFILGKHVVLPEERSERFNWHVNRWRRIVEWQLGDELLHTIVQNYLECNLPDDVMEAPQDRLVELLNVSPFDEGEDAGIVDEAHDMWFTLQAQERIPDDGAKNPVVIEPFGRQPAKDQYRVGLDSCECYRDELKRDLKKTKGKKEAKGTKSNAPAQKPEPPKGSTPPPAKEKSTVVAYFCNPGGPDNTGIPLSDSLQLTDEILGLQGHWYFWWFPSTIPPPESTPNIPVMTPADRKSLITRAHLQERYLQAVERFITYLGLTWQPSKTPNIIPGIRDGVRWLVRDHHDHPRIARAIVSLGEMNQQHLAKELYNAVIKMAEGSEVDTERWRTAYEAIPEPRRYSRAAGKKRQRPITVSEGMEKLEGDGKRRRKWKEDKGDKVELEVRGVRKRALEEDEEPKGPKKRVRIEGARRNIFGEGSSVDGGDEYKPEVHLKRALEGDEKEPGPKKRARVEGARRSIFGKGSSVEGCEPEVHANFSPPPPVVNSPLHALSQQNEEGNTECHNTAAATSELEPISTEVAVEQEVEGDLSSSFQSSLSPRLPTPVPDDLPSSPFVEKVDSLITIGTHAASEPGLWYRTDSEDVGSEPGGVRRRRWNSVGV
ncbi:hypothetical protein K440DRAFT_663182 [Wilcoxina mikolae CBS 423.85]|nr:hypothetical protein K440DRAFT_663182 [Wilcoxina mikolae CBS 423.85]